MIKIFQGSNITKLRDEHNISQEELANLLNIHVTTLSRWENNHAEPKASHIKRLCEIFQITESELLSAPPDNSWILEIKISNREVIDMTQCGSISNLDLQKNYAALTLGGSYEMFEDDGKFEDFINQLRAARPVVIETGRKLRGIL